MEDIYELLNHAEMNLEEFENQKLSDYESKVAKKQILKEVRKMKNSKKALRRTFAAAACACAIIGIGSISVAAEWLPVPDSFKAVFGISTEEELAVANTMGTSTDIVAENNGYKVSAEGVVGDGKNIGVVFKIEKSDGSTLLDNGTVPAEVEFKEINDRDGSWSHAVAGKVDGNDNEKCMEYYVAFTYWDSVEENVFISLEDMQLWGNEERIDVSGNWEFDIPFEAKELSVNLAIGQKFKYGNSEGTIDELMVSPIGFSVRVTTTDKLPGSDFIDMPMEIHLKSGEVVELHGACGPADNGNGTWSWREEGVYENMILLDSVESVIIGDTGFSLK